MSQCAEHVAHQLPNEYTRVSYLLDAIENSDAALQAAMALCWNDTGPNGRRSNFEATTSFILPHDPVARKRTTQRQRGSAQVSKSTTTISATSGTNEPRTKRGIGKTGVPLRFHTAAEYAKLTREQKVELREFRDKREIQGKSQKLLNPSNKSKGNYNNRQNKRLKSMVAEAVAKQLESNEPPNNETTNDDEKTLRKYLVSLMKGSESKAPTNPPGNANASSAQARAPVTLRSILRKAKPA